MKQIHKAENKIRKDTRQITSNLTLEERLQVIANLIVDRILEDQLNGSLKLRTKQNSQP